MTPPQAETQAPPGPRQDILAGIGAAAAQRPEAVATEAFGKAWTWQQLAERIARMTAVLRQAGVGPERRLGLMLPPCPTALVASVAALRLGATIAPCNPLLQGEALREELDAIGPGVLVSIDLLGIQERWLPQLSDLALSAVMIERTAELLPFPKNIILPMMRGSQIAATPIAERAKSLRGLLRRAQAEETPLEEASATAAVLDGESHPRSLKEIEAAGAALLKTVEGRGPGEGAWLFAHNPSNLWALTAMLTPLAAGRRISISPRLHPKSVAQDIAGKQPEVVVLSPVLAEEMARRPDRLAGPRLLVLSPETDSTVVATLEQAGREAGFEVLVWADLPA